MKVSTLNLHSYRWARKGKFSRYFGYSGGICGDSKLFSLGLEVCQLQSADQDPLRLLGAGDKKIQS